MCSDPYMKAGVRPQSSVVAIALLISLSSTACRNRSSLPAAGSKEYRDLSSAFYLGLAALQSGRGYVNVHYHGSPYYYRGGIWYRPYGPSFMVVAPPIGIGFFPSGGRRAYCITQPVADASGPTWM